MKKKLTLSQALHHASGKTISKKEISEEKTPSFVPHKKTSKTSQKGREGKKIVAGYFDPMVVKQLKIVSLEQDETIQSLLSEAINDLLQKYGKSS
jgi:hypothetical protein